MATSEFQNPSSSSSSNPGGRYDVFLSFRGSDTRKKFTDHLYHTLKREGFQTFRDDDEIDRGHDIKSELVEAIRNSRMSVIVLSQNYAKSTACLLELQTIIERCKKSDHSVLPIFYEVDPSVLKEQSKNLDFGKKEVTDEKVKGWKVALKEIASMAGMVSQNQFDGYEAKFIEEIVGELKRKLACKELGVDNHLVGMDSRTEHVNCWLKDKSGKVGILLICGMGGIGKTTIAKVVYNSNHDRYDAASFLENISGVSKGHNGLVRLQRHLLSDILGKKELITNVDDGRRQIKYALSNKRVLLVLDDVDHTEQLFALAGQEDWSSPGSKVIITTRLERLMNTSNEIFDVYWPEKLSNDESLELFSWHAFRQKLPIQSHMGISKRFVQYCDGLPLALKVKGSFCRQKDAARLEDEIHKLQTSSDNTIQEVFQISYDSLQDNHDKKLFLDIACFFVGMKKNDTIMILDGCDYFALVGIHNLVEKNLLAIEKNKLEMHQLLQDMGKQIVSRESYYPEMRSRIWRPKESFSILLEKNGTNKIEGLILDMNMLGNSNKVVFEANTFEKMYNLRLLKLSGVQLFGTSKAFPKRLRWLYWRGFLSTSFPNDFPLENLVSLDMRYSNLKQFWKGTTVLGSLKKINLSHSPKFAKTRDFSRMPNLEKLVLKACPSLLEIDKSIVELRRIESLNLQDCKKLRKLPKNIGMVESLVELDISGCSNLMGAIEELEKMKSLQVLNASGMEVVSQASIWSWVLKPRVQMSLASLPSSLVRLNLSRCNLTDDAFPRDLKLPKLQYLFLGGNPISSVPNFIKDLPILQMLDLSRCPKLQQIRWPSTIVQHVVVTQCDALEKVTFEPGTENVGVTHTFCWNLNHVQCRHNFLPVTEADVELIQTSTDFLRLDSMADVKVTMIKYPMSLFGKHAFQMMYEKNVFNTFFPGREVPHWFSNKNSGSTISFTVTLSPHSGFRGLNLCAVCTLPAKNKLVCTLPAKNKLLQPPFYYEISNKRTGKNMLLYRPGYYGIPEDGEDLVWLSHCLISYLFNEGDEVEVLFGITGGGQIKECGVHLLYFGKEGEVCQYISTIHHSWDSTMHVHAEATTGGAEEEASSTGVDTDGVLNADCDGFRAKRKRVEHADVSLEQWTKAWRQDGSEDAKIKGTICPNKLQIIPDE